MQNQNIKHIELRINLGNMFTYDINSKNFTKYISINNEMEILYNQLNLYSKYNMSLNIICQTSRQYNTNKISNYFNKIIDIINIKFYLKLLILLLLKV